MHPGGSGLLPDERLKSGCFPVGLVSCRDNSYMVVTAFGQKIPVKRDEINEKP